jgi:hypothetical protein
MRLAPRRNGHHGGDGTVEVAVAARRGSMSRTKLSTWGRLVGVGSVAAVTVLALGASPASAHYNYIYHGDDFASINAAHTSISVCNEERDGHVVRAEVLRSNGQQYSYGDYTENGSCASFSLVSSASLWRLCETSVSCSTYRQV